MAATQDGEQNQRADNGNDDRAKTAEAVREESEHPPISSGDTLSVCIIGAVDGVELELQHDPPKREFRSCCMRWIFRLIMMALAAKLVNRYLGSRQPQPRSQG